MAFNFFAAVSGSDAASSIAFVLLLVYFLWIYGWGKKQVGPKFGLLIAVVITFLVFVLYPEFIWVPVIIVLFVIFGKDLLAKVQE